jgi:hypothetical protein
LLFILNRPIGHFRTPQYYSNSTASTKEYVFCSCPQVVLREFDTDETPRVRGAEEEIHTRHCTPVTPDQISRSNHHVQPVGHHNTVALASKDDGPTNGKQSNTHILIAARSPSRQQRASPNKTANIRVRRSDYGTTLLQSPARAGYASRMRQLFEEAGRNHEFQPTGNELYPQLANVSRKASPPPIRSPLRGTVPRGTMGGSTEYRLESLCLSTALPIAVPSKVEAQQITHDLSERSSGSWSNDSGYLITQPLGRDCSFTVPPNERIYTWLLDVPDEQGDLAKDGIEVDASLEQPGGGINILQEICETDEDGLLSASSNSETSPIQMPGLQSTLNDPFVCNNEGAHPQAPTRRAPHRIEPFATDIEDHTRRNACEVRKRLDFDHSAAPHTPTLQQRSHASPLFPVHTPSTRSHATESQALEEGSIQLSPLSPNVCIERGPSRYHSPRRSRDANNLVTPSKVHLVTRFQSPQLKENVGLRREGGACVASPLAPRSNRTGTRFRHPQ